ncbi:unnamed protein product [Phytomonas sp. EM1]|nr:unnamed protein product [Phytomonas sp. EM1]|eukprot:CCW63665.1 unnamed protein product [Phytomonas sp. isolate EM1]
MQWRKRPHTRSPSLRAAPAPPFSVVSTATSGVYVESQRRARQQLLRDLLCNTSLAELRDREILRWLDDADGWLRSPEFLAGELTELRLLVLGVLNTMPWWRILESVAPSQDQLVYEDSEESHGFARSTEGATSQKLLFSSSTFEKQSSRVLAPVVASTSASASAPSVISSIIRLHERIQLAFEKVCLTLLEGSQRTIPNVLEAILKPFNVEPSVKDGARRAIPADSIVRVLNQIATKCPTSDVLTLFERCLPTLVPKRRWANGRHHVICTTIFLYLALEGQVPGYHPSCGNSQCLARTQELFEVWILSATVGEWVSSSPCVSHASSQGICSRKDAGEGENRDAATGNNITKVKEEDDFFESKTHYALPPSIISKSAPVAPTPHEVSSGNIDTSPFHKVGQTGGRGSDLEVLSNSGEKNPAAEGYDTSSSSFSGTAAALGGGTVLKMPERSALADFSDSEGTNYSESGDTSLGRRPHLDGAALSRGSGGPHHAVPSSADRASPFTGASPKDMLLSAAASHAATSTLTSIQTTPQNNRMLAYRSELIHFVLGRLEAMELSLDHTEGVGEEGHPPNARGGSLSHPSSSVRGLSPVGSLSSTPRAFSCPSPLLKEPRQLYSPTLSSHRSVGGFSGFSTPFFGPRANRLVVDPAQPQYEVLKQCCAVVFYMLVKDLCRQQAAGVCGNVDWWRVLVGFQLRVLASSSEVPVCVQFIAPSLAMFGQEEEAVDMIHKVVTLVTKGLFPPSLRGASSGVTAEGFGRTSASVGSAAVGAPARLRMAPPPAMATTQGLSIPQRIRAARSIAPMFKFMKDRIANGEGVRKRLLKWVAQEMGREATGIGGRGAFSRLVEVVFAQCAAISEMMGVAMVPSGNSGSGAAEGSQTTPLLQPIGGGAGKSAVELLQPLLSRYALEKDDEGGLDVKCEEDPEDRGPGRVRMNLAQMERDELLQPWLMEDCPWGDLLARMSSSTA